MARPISTSFSREEEERIQAHILREIAEGRSVSRILREDKGLCSYSIWCGWVAESDKLKDRVERAREDGATRYVEEIIEISDQGNADPYIAYRDDGKTPYAKIDGDCIQRAKLRVYAREKYAAMIAPRRYGQKLDVTSDGKALPTPQTAVLVDNRVNALVLLASQRKAEGLTLIEGEVVDPLDEIMK